MPSKPKRFFVAEKRFIVCTWVGKIALMLGPWLGMGFSKQRVPLQEASPPQGGFWATLPVRKQHCEVEAPAFPPRAALGYLHPRHGVQPQLAGGRQCFAAGTARPHQVKPRHSAAGSQSFSHAATLSAMVQFVSTIGQLPGSEPPPNGSVPAFQSPPPLHHLMFDVSIHFAPPLAPALATSRPHISGPTKSIGGSRIQQSAAASTRPLADGIAPGRAASAPAATRSTARRHALEMWCGVGQEAERAPGRARVVGRQLRALGAPPIC